jgi:hypothetical protein
MIGPPKIVGMLREWVPGLPGRGLGPLAQPELFEPLSLFGGKTHQRDRAAVAKELG